MKSMLDMRVFVTMILVITCICGCSLFTTRNKDIKRIKIQPSKFAKVNAYLFTGQPKKLDIAALRRDSGFKSADTATIEDLLADKRWRPRRHFGPFFTGSDFEQIRIAITSNAPLGTATPPVWHFNEFQSSLSAVELPTYNLYFNNSIPTSSSAVNLEGNIVLSLKKIEYSSQYGGTLRLIFQLCDFAGYNGPWTVGQPSLPSDRVFHYDDFGYELITQNFRFDLNETEVSFFVQLFPPYFNPTPNFPNPTTGDVTPEVSATAATIYKAGVPVHPGSTEFSQAMVELDTWIGC